MTEGTARDTLVLPYNNVSALEAACAAHGGQIAAVIVEPIVGNMGCVLPRPEFVQALRELTRRHGALLIFDEVITGFRVAYGGAQSLLGVQPDLTTLGKIIGGGLPMGAYGGRADIMDHVLPAGKVFQAGTLSGNPAGHGRRDRHAFRPPRQQSLSGIGLPRRAVGGGIRPGRGRRRPAPHDRPGRLDDDVILQFRAGDRLGHGRQVRHAAVRRDFSGA